jgi:hypothetical protein
MTHSEIHSGQTTSDGIQGRKAPTKRQVIIAAAFTAPLLLAVVHICARSAGSLVNCDFNAMYAAGLTVRAGHGHELYDLQKQAALQQKLFHRGDFLVEDHPPFEALLLAPLTKLSFAQAYELWGAINIALWMLFAYFIRSYVPSTPTNALRYLPLCFLFYPAWVVMFQGQTSFLVLVIYTLTFLCLKRGRDLWAGAFLGLGLIKFTVVLPFALICLLRKKWRMMAGFALAASLLGVISIATVGFAGALAYLHLLLDIACHSANPAYATVRPWTMPTIQGFLGALLGSHVQSVWINTAVALVSGLLLLLTARQWRRADRSGSGAEQNLMFAAGLAVSLLTSPHLYTHDLALMLLAILLVVGSPLWTEGSGWRVILTVSIAILYLPPVYLLLPVTIKLYVLALALMSFALTTLFVVSPAGQSPFTDNRDAGFVRLDRNTETLRVGKK